MTEPKWWDFTASKEKGNTRENVIARLEPMCDRFVVGDEVGTDGYAHLQGRIVLKTGKTLETLINLGWGWHWSPTHVRDFEYCKKEGNYYISWEKTISKYANIELRTWQKMALEEMDDQDEREISVIYDPDGNKGKTYFSKFCVATHRATYCPPMQEAQDFMAFAMAKPDKAYIFDMPRSESIKQKKGMWSAIEQIKNGYLYDKRYQYRDMWIDPPKILVFCNELPDTESLSSDRWRIYEFTKYGIEDWLVPHEPRLPQTHKLALRYRVTLCEFVLL